MQKLRSFNCRSNNKEVVIDMKVLFLPNWKVIKSSSSIDELQSADWYNKENKYWFFKFWFQEDLDVKIVDVQSNRFFEVIEKRILRFYIVQAIRSLWYSRDVDIIISHGGQSALFLAIIRKIMRMKKAKHVLIDVGCINGGSDNIVKIFLSKWAVGKIDFFITHSSDHIEYYRKYFPEIVSKSKYIPFGVDVEFFASKERNEEKDYILSFGYHSRDWDLLIKAYSESSAQYKLLVAGCERPGHECVPNVEYLGRVRIDKLKELIERARFIILPLVEKKYSHGQMSVLQSMAMRKAVVTTDIGAINDYVIHDYNAYLCQLGDVKDMIAAINKLCVDQEYIKRIGFNAFESVKMMYNEGAMSKSIEGVVRNIING